MSRDNRHPAWLKHECYILINSKCSFFSRLLQVHEEFKQNVENIGIDNLIQKFAEQKGTGKERPGTVKSSD